VMVTGDHPATAVAIAREVGISADSVLVGSQLDALDPEQLSDAIRRVSVFARVTPEDKHHLVTAAQRNGEIAVVTGDGVNDAVALRAANVGVAMGTKGTDVAKEAAGVVLTDNNYSTLARGVFEGRHLFDNLRKGVLYYLAVKVALIAIFLLPVLVGLPLPFSPVQIIVLELFMDLAASAGFVSEPAEADVTTRSPRKAEVLDPPGVKALFFRGALLFSAVMAAYGWGRWHGLSPQAVQSCAFTAWMVGHVALAFLSRSEHEWLFRHGVFTNRVMNIWAVTAVAFLLIALYVPPIQEAVRFAWISPRDFVASAVLALLLVLPAELVGWREKSRKPSAPTLTVAAQG
jgi:Ca2+-transporting ATPase